MLSALIIAATSEAAEEVGRLCGQSTDICVYKALETYPHLHEVVRLVNTYSPDMVFVQLGGADGEPSARKVREVVDEIRIDRPETLLIGILPAARAEGLKLAAELSIVEILTSPIRREEFQAAIFRGLDRAAGETRAAVHAFLPAKSGSGATVTALNVAECLARDFHRKVLLLEADILSGPIAVMLNIQPEHTVEDALEYNDPLTDEAWRKLVTRMNGLDVMAASGAAPPGEASRFSYFRLLTFAQRRYDDIVVDFPGVVEEPAEALLARAKAVYLVCTPELTSMALARRRLRQLELREVPEAALRVVLNRADQSRLTPAAIEELIGHRIEAVLPNDYHAVQEAVEAGGFVDPYTKLGGAFIDFAARIAGESAPKREAFERGALPEQVPS